MTLSNFEVVHERGSSGAWGFADPLIVGFDGKQPVLAFIAREALADHFGVPYRLRTLQEWNLVVESHRAAFEKIIVAKYERGERSTYNAGGESYPRVDVTFEDIERSGEKLTDDVLKVM